MNEIVGPLIKTVTIGLDLNSAFRRFTADISRWWPMARHSVSQSAQSSVLMETQSGGRIVERETDGTEHIWGTISQWDPPKLLRFSWHPGRQADTAQQITVEFEEETPNTTRVRLTHDGWESYGEGRDEMQRGYDSGWDSVLSLYVRS
ncbi:MAG: SRPBCC domain-containing protein [Gemmatimonadota bacterium]|nr:SRPBCC domain-containing protein [Gemmatimonadota bacterium]MDH5804861.1 SRPBCC domain-containing protein [Gemmatimonadota bacterium]